MIIFYNSVQKMSIAKNVTLYLLQNFVGCIIIAVAWKRIKAVALSRTRNAVVGETRHEGSNPSASAIDRATARCF